MTAAADLLADYARGFGVELDPGQIAAFARLGQELLRWNRSYNLTAITDPAEVVTKHFVDSLTLAPLLRGGGELLDIGSGAGFPAIPLKIALPELAVVTVDSVLKKIHFQRHIVRTLGLQGITPLHVRVESLAVHSGGKFDFIVSRAFSSLADFIRLALPLLAPSGQLIAMKGREGRAEAEQFDWSGSGVRVAELREFALPEMAGERSIIRLERVDCHIAG